jgi:hypothetical protein
LQTRADTGCFQQGQRRRGHRPERRHHPAGRDPGGFIWSKLFGNRRTWGAWIGIRFPGFDAYARGQETAGIFYTTFANVHLGWTRDDAQVAVLNVAIEDDLGVHNRFLEMLPWDIPAPL